MVFLIFSLIYLILLLFNNFFYISKDSIIKFAQKLKYKWDDILYLSINDALN